MAAAAVMAGDPLGVAGVGAPRRRRRWPDCLHDRAERLPIHW